MANLLGNISEYEYNTAMKIERQYESFVFGAVLYSCQASQSIVRAIPDQLDELREFYAMRPTSRDIASKIWTYAGKRKNARRGLANPFLIKDGEVTNLYILSRLLLDFSGCSDIFVGK